MVKKLSERLLYLMADNGIKQSGGLLADLKNIEAIFEEVKQAPTYSEAHEDISTAIAIVLGEDFGE